MGAAVGIMAGMKLKHDFPNLECWGYSTPACVTLDLASGSCESYVTSFLANHDIVPRFSVASVEQLRQRIFDFNWEEGDRIAHGDEDWEKIKVGADSLRQVQQKQNDISKSVQQAQEGVSEKVQLICQSSSWRSTKICHIKESEDCFVSLIIMHTEQVPDI
jgi:hypothetical protein